MQFHEESGHHFRTFGLHSTRIASCKSRLKSFCSAIKFCQYGWEKCFRKSWLQMHFSFSFNIWTIPRCETRPQPNQPFIPPHFQIYAKVPIVGSAHHPLLMLRGTFLDVIYIHSKINQEGGTSHHHSLLFTKRKHKNKKKCEFNATLLNNLIINA